MNMEAKSVEISVEELMGIMEKLQNIRGEMDLLMEELEILIDSELMESISRGKDDIKKGNVYTLNELKSMVKE